MDRETLKIHESSGIGEVHISNEVVSIIAGLATTEVEGVAGMVGTSRDGFNEFLGKKNLAKGVEVEVIEDTVNLSLVIVIDFGYNIPDVTKNVQHKVSSAVETMTGLNVKEVNIRIADVKLN